LKNYIYFLILFSNFIFADECDLLRELYLSRPQKSEFLPVDFAGSCGRGDKYKVKKRWLENPSVKKLVQNFNKFCKTKPLDLFSQKEKIPKIFHFVWIGPPMPDRVKVAIDSWRYFHPDYTIKIWDDAAVESIDWISEKFKHNFSIAASYSEKSDYIRVQVLYNFGGIYVDTDFICLKSFDCLVDKDIEFFAGFELCYGTKEVSFLLNGALMGCVAKSKILENCFSTFIPIDEAPQLNPAIRTGPHAISKAVDQYITSFGNEGILALPCTYFYPTFYEWKIPKISNNYEEFLKLIGTETMAVHLWAHSWANQ